jgi:DNA invertase Pin-like site-specific DNA recombinase
MDQGQNLSLSDQSLKYCLYSRKSTESDELQQLSIQTQIKEMLLVAQRENIEVIKMFEESHSAKDSGQRPIFNQMVRSIKDGTYDAILTWAPDRL